MPTSSSFSHTHAQQETRAGKGVGAGAGHQFTKVTQQNQSATNGGAKHDNKF